MALSTLAHDLTVTPTVDSEVKQLRALPRPAVDRRLLEQYLTDVVRRRCRHGRTVLTAVCS